MAKPYDATMKQIVEANPQDWLALLGFPRLPVEIIDADLATITTDADRILRTLEPPFRGFHIEFEAGKDARFIGQRTHRYNALAETLHNMPIASIVFLLNSKAGSLLEANGVYERIHPETGQYLYFRYTAIRVWELPLELVLSGGLATLPLALLTNLKNADAQQVVETVANRLKTEATDEEAKTLIAASYLLAGLQFSDTIISSLFKGVLDMLEESSTYQALITRGLNQGIAQGIQQGIGQGIEQGRVEGAQRALRLAGEGRLGTPNASVQERLNSIDAVDRLDYLLSRIFAVETWDELLAA